MYHQLRVFEEVCMLDRRARRVAAIRRVFHREVMPTPVLERLAQRLLGAPLTPSVSAALAICDPGWREYLERQRAAAR